MIWQKESRNGIVETEIAEIQICDWWR